MEASWWRQASGAAGASSRASRPGGGQGGAAPRRRAAGAARARAPVWRGRGGAGGEREILLELKVLSDVGLVGLPNAGKSSLLRVLSAARPRVGEYPFTTLSPQLGVVDEKTHKNPFVVADIPGLISGASEGRGLGNRFLRHVARARLLALVLDASEDPEGAQGTLVAELHAAGLSERPTVTALNKIDLLDEELRDYLREAFPGAFLISAETGEGVEAFRDHVEGMVRRLGARDAMPATEREHRVYRPTWKGLQVGKENGGFRVTGEDVERLALKTDWESPEGAGRFPRGVEEGGVAGALRGAGGGGGAWAASPTGRAPRASSASSGSWRRAASLGRSGGPGPRRATR